MARAANGVAGPHGYDGDRGVFSGATPARTASDPLPTFREVLSALNPLQYLPVVGTIYRVVTGDQGSPALRTGVSMITGMLMGGPLGLMTSMAGSWFENMFHLESAAHTMIAGNDAPPPPPPALPPVTPPRGLAGVARAIGAYSLSQRLAGVG